ncbi:LysE family translocator [Marinobacterium jannaschii]|uniref:LysE family translocator n=1 Tax=Marinobacterium jannaschii TaxID=64970 RepID=UPI000482D77B|nr:LysE family translocator [Marinobacterium jannaschii]
MTPDTWILYLLAVMGLSASPGPNGLLALTHGALYGHKRTLFTVSGGTLGFMLLISLSMFGIGALIQASTQALTILKWAGGAYLVWLGIQLWRSPPMNLASNEQAQQRSNGTLFRQGFISAISNPKVLLFFGAFLPQFIDPTAPLWTQFLVMALTFAVVEFVVECALARVAHQLRPWLERSGKRFNRACGGIFAIIGTALPLSQ